jgi:hypothetical protein
MIKTTLLSIYKKIVEWDKKLEVYINGEDNAYPERMERYRNNSVTASMASNVMVQYLLGKGFGEIDNKQIGDYKLKDIADDIARDIVDNRGVFIHVSYNANFDVSEFKVLPFTQCRLGEKDSKLYNGKILVYPNWSENKIDKNKVSVIDVYNPNPEIVAYQIASAGGIDKYKGQVLYYNMDNQFYYPLSRIDAVSFECDNEYQASVYKNELLRRGFFGKTLVVTRPLIEDAFYEDFSDEGIKRLTRLKSERQNFKDGIKKFIGAGEVGGVMHLEVDFAGERLDDAILFKNIDSNINPDLFRFTEDSAIVKILMAYNNLPVALVKSPDSSLLGNSGAALVTAKETYWENTTKERSLLVGLMNELWIRHIDYNGVPLQITPLITKEINTNTALAEKQRAQATLKGSVGGVSALLEIIRSVRSGETDYGSALAIIEEIYGVNTEKAKELLGNPLI